MAILKNKNKKIEIKDGDKIKNACKKLEIPFCCEEGICGSCLIEVKSGEKNLSELSEAERDLGLGDDSRRLACQCKIINGTVEIEPF